DDGGRRPTSVGQIESNKSALVEEGGTRFERRFGGDVALARLALDKDRVRPRLANNLHSANGTGNGRVERGDECALIALALVPQPQGTGEDGKDERLVDRRVGANPWVALGGGAGIDLEAPDQARIGHGPNVVGHA